MPHSPDPARSLADPRTTVVETRVEDGHVRIHLGAPQGLGEGEGSELVQVAPGVVAAITEHGGDLDGFTDARTALLGHDQPDAARLLGAIALGQWRARTRFCPRCGRPLAPEPGGRVLRCADGHQEFPRLEPAVIMRVVDADDRILLARQARWPAGRFSVLAGFVDPGESLEDTVRREVHEEVGIRVQDVTYVRSQPWPFPSSLMLAFTARVRGATDLVPQDGEIAEARWLSRVELAAAMESGAVGLPPPLSVAHHLIADWLGAPLATWDVR